MAKLLIVNQMDRFMAFERGELPSQRPIDDTRPLVCLDEFAKQLLSESRAPIPATGRHVARHDYEYVREGSVSGFMIAMPHLGGRDVFIGEDGRRTAKDFAACLDYLANKVLPEADKIVLVMDNLGYPQGSLALPEFPAGKGP
jgi:hypothetical protein